MATVFNGLPVAKGIVIGKVHKYYKEEIEVDTYNIEKDDIERELWKLSKARELATIFLNSIKEKAARKLGPEEIKIFQAHLLMLNDPMLNGEIERNVREERINIEAAVQRSIKNIKERLSSIDNNYFQERIKDIQDVGNHLLNALTGNVRSLHSLSQEVIVLAEDLTPSEITLLDNNYLKGFIFSEGGETSHTSILAKSLMVPTIINAEGILEAVQHGETVILDAVKGIIHVRPEQQLIEKYGFRIEEYENYQQKLHTIKHKQAVTRDGYSIKLSANIAAAKNLEDVLAINGDGIGLFRTEFLYFNQEHQPAERDLFNVFKEIAIKMAPRPVVIRTLDIGGDKDLPYLEIPQEMNPFLGWRGIRLTLERIDLLKTQLRAILRASHYGHLKIMFPMVTSIEELRQAQRIVEEVKSALRQAGIPFDPAIKIGIMIEVPSTAIAADLFAREVDFFSIGTNDLIQYALAVDRNNSKIAHLYSPYHPAVLRLIKDVVNAGCKEKIPVSICGEAGADPLLLPLFIAMRVDELSMNVASILETKESVRNLAYQDCRQYLDHVLKLSTGQEVLNYLTKIRKEDKPLL